MHCKIVCYNITLTLKIWSLKKLFRAFNVALLHSILFAGLSFAQILFETEKGKIEIPSFERNGNIYISAIEFSKSVNSGWHYNNETKKVEIKFEKNNIKFTAFNQFIVSTSRINKSFCAYQLPISTIGRGNDVYFPLSYSLPLINLLSERNFNFIKKDKILKEIKKSEPKDENVNVGVNYTGELETRGFEIYDIEIAERSNGTMIRLKSHKPIIQYSSSMIDGNLVLTLVGVTIDEKIADYKPTGLIQKISLKKFSSSVQLTFQLKSGYTTTESFRDAETPDLLISIHNQLLKESNEKEAKIKDNRGLDVIVIDPGHGGKDPGAIGVTGVKEKDINLKIALELGALIEKNLKGVKVVYTRKDDRFVELYKRGKIANENKGKLFISIHCNSMPKGHSDFKGYEIYLLRPGRTAEAITIAEIENSVIKYEDNPERYQKLTDENFILVTMAHSAYMRFSEQFAEILNKKLEEKVDIGARGVKQAGFYVLVGATMPSILFEAGFLSNYNDEAFLNTKEGRGKIAQGLFEAIKKFKEDYDKSTQLEL